MADPGFWLGSISKFEQAVEMYLTVLTIGEKSLGHNHPIIVSARRNLKSARIRALICRSPVD